MSRRHIRIPFIEQTEHSDCGLACVAMLIAAFTADASLEELRSQYGVPRGGYSLQQLSSILRDHGIEVRGVRIPSVETMRRVDAPCLLLWDDHHYVVLERFAYGRFIILDPARGDAHYHPRNAQDIVRASHCWCSTGKCDHAMPITDGAAPPGGPCGRSSKASHGQLSRP